MRTLFTFLGTAFLLAFFWQAEVYLLEHVEMTRDHNIYRFKVIENEL